VAWQHGHDVAPAGTRVGLSFYEFSEDVERTARASLLPRRFGVDGIILFYDITTLPVAMGLPFALRFSVGPVPSQPVHTQADLDRLQAEPDPEHYRHVRDLLLVVRSELAGALPVLVFAGAPVTVAAYCIGTGKDMAATRRFAAEQPGIWAGLVEPDEYEHWAQPHHEVMFAAAAGVPRILFVKEGPIWGEWRRRGRTWSAWWCVTTWRRPGKLRHNRMKNKAPC
jgi:uroporphyrinogen decarboxylase